MEKRDVYNYARLYLKNTIKFCEDRLNKEVLTENEENRIKSDLKSLQQDLLSIEFDLKVLWIKGE